MPAESAYPLDAGPVLVRVARGAISAELGLPADGHDTPAWLAREGASFITLMRE